MIQTPLFEFVASMNSFTNNFNEVGKLWDKAEFDPWFAGWTWRRYGRYMEDGPDFRARDVEALISVANRVPENWYEVV